MARILVADDEPTIRHMVKAALLTAGHQVSEAIDGPTTVTAYLREKPEVLVLDVNMPGGGGRFALNSLRFGGEKRICPVLILTGSIDASPDEIKTMFQVERVLMKPFRAHDVIAAVAEMLVLASRHARESEHGPHSGTGPAGSGPA
jgi:DNA-binding response OmpR family regulator